MALVKIVKGEAALLRTQLSIADNPDWLQQLFAQMRIGFPQLPVFIVMLSKESFGFVLLYNFGVLL